MSANNNKNIGGKSMLKPLGDRVVLKVEEEKEQTVGGFVLAGAGKERHKRQLL